MKQKLKSLIKKITVLFFKLKVTNTYLQTKKNNYIIKTIISNKGKMNSIQLEEGVSLKKCRFIFKGNNNTVIIDKESHIQGVTFWIEDDNNTIKIGEKCTFEGNTQLAACEGTSIVLGNDCMFANDIYMRTTDSHSITDYNNKRLNPAQNINIGNHVWIGMQCIILKGTTIPDNCIVGARSIVTSKVYYSNSILAGTPATTIKQNINWERKRI